MRSKVLWGALVVWAATLVLMPLVGPSEISLARAWAGISPDAEILWRARVPRVVLALLAGGALATAGVLFQALMRDALATPDTLGVSSGASLGAVAAICFGWEAGVWPVGLAGAGIVLLLVTGLAGRAERGMSFTLLMAGITVNAMCVALILFLQTVSAMGRSLVVTRWLMGGLDSVETTTLGILALMVLPAVGLVLWRAGDWNLLAVGAEWAAAKGIEVKTSLRAGYFLGSLLAGSVTAITGPIGFAGLIVPHILRMTLGADHRQLVPAAFLLGGAFLALCDGMARKVFAPAEMPVGVITALLGGPFFLWVLTQRARIRG
ncbi:MAG: iron ABC transporter permease [Bryobacter sp.]|nr:iron ABC transporter permease [Bryobacter sp.]